jgi:hypothetical protein
VLDAVIGNVENIVAFRVGNKDARVLSEHFGGEFLPAQFADLGNHCVYLKLLHHGEPVTPFPAVTQSPRGTHHRKRANILTGIQVPSFSCSNGHESQVRIGLAAGGRWIRTVGPP